jgi:hypothetical protein
MALCLSRHHLVASSFKGTTNSNNNKPNKKPAGPGPTKQEFEQIFPLNAVYWQWEAKCHAIRNQEEEDTKVQ